MDESEVAVLGGVGGSGNRRGGGIKFETIKSNPHHTFPSFLFLLVRSRSAKKYTCLSLFAGDSQSECRGDRPRSCHRLGRVTRTDNKGPMADDGIDAFVIRRSSLPNSASLFRAQRTRESTPPAVSSGVLRCSKAAADEVKRRETDFLRRLFH